MKIITQQIGTTSNGTTYQTHTFSAGGNTWECMRASGKLNYVSLRKCTNNPFATLGREFPTFDAACMAYKSADMKTGILISELLLNG